MSATLAIPYPGFMVHYTHRDSGKEANQENIISYGASQLPIQDRPTEIRYHPDTTQSVFGPASTLATDRLLSRQPLPTPSYDTQGYGHSSFQNRRKRHRSDNEREISQDTDYNYGHLPALQTLPIDSSVPTSESTDLTYPGHVDVSSHHTSNHDYLGQVNIPQQHHHHRLPSYAVVSSSSGDDDGRTGKPEDYMDLSFMSIPGVPRPWPPPKGPKTRFGHKEDDLLIELKERWNFSWKQIGCFFPGRRHETLQVRYCAKLKHRIVIWDEEKVCLSPK